MLFADPPDNLGLAYDNYQDNLPDSTYYAKFEQWLLWSLHTARVVWFSYYWKHDLEVKYLVRSILRNVYPTFTAKTFIWRYTFGQYQQTDCASGYRYLLRLRYAGTPIYPESIMVPSRRNELGDPRGNPEGRVPDDVWDFPRVVGNSPERQNWHPTQHPMALVARVMKLSTVPGDKVIDLFGGTGTVAKVAKALGRECDTCEISPVYCEKIKEI